MANVKINQLPLATTPLIGTEVFPLVQGTTTKQVSITGLFTSPVMTNPTLGTVGQADLINATGLPISTGVAGLGTGVATFLATPSSANLRAAVTDETGTGALVFATSPTLVTPDLGTPTAMVATNITGTALGLIAGSTVTNANLTGAVTSVGNATSLGSFTSAQLATALTDETGSGANVFATSPVLVTPNLGTPSAAVLTNATGLPISTGVSGLGTSVATALGVAVGSAGAVVVNGGALGTPASGNFSSGTFTWPTFNQNTTGTAANITATSNSTLTTLSALSLPGSQVSGNISGNAANVTGIVAVANGGTGTSTPSLVQGTNITITGTWPNQTINASGGASGTVTSVSGTGTVSGITLTGTVTTSGSLTLGGTLDLSSPPAIGGTTPAAITGTIVTATTRFVGVYGGAF